ncbi:MAG: hypothetical protein EAZ30_17920 [Betaproteobacteria bacterium]|nr:MAG: hypothetical protein EAZ30_17920 [Betaproteobacteria bacterium]
MAVTDGRRGLPEALEGVFPKTTLQTCIAHLIHHSLNFKSRKNRKAIAFAIYPIYTAVNTGTANAALGEFEASTWRGRFPTLAALSRRAWDSVIRFYAFPPAVRRIIETTNAVESVTARLRKIIKMRGRCPCDDAP